MIRTSATVPQQSASKA